MNGFQEAKKKNHLSVLNANQQGGIWSQKIIRENNLFY